MNEVRSSDGFSIAIVHPNERSVVYRAPLQNNSDEIKFEIGPERIISAITPPLIQHMTKEQVEELIRCNPGDNRFEFLPNVKGKSKAWRDFKILLFEGIPQDFARCNFCSAIVTYSNRTGTGALLRHKCNNFRNNFNDKREKLTLVRRKKTRNKNKQLSEDRKRYIIEKEAKFLIRDLLPVKTVDSSGFRSLAQALIDVGADYGNQSIDDVLVNGQALLDNYVSEVCGKIKNDIVGTLLLNNVSFTCDLWTDGRGETHHLTLAGHVILDNFETKHFILGTRKFLYQRTPESMHNMVINILSEYVGDVLAESKLREGTIVSDNRTNVAESFHPYTTLSCACHMLNSVVEDAFYDQGLVDILTSVKKVVDYCNRNSKLSRYLTRGNDTRWSSSYYMLRDVYEMRMEISASLSDRNELDLKAIGDIIEFLDLFKDCSESLSADSQQPTLHEVVLWKMKIENHCKSNVEDTALIAHLKRDTLHRFRQRFSLHHLHYVALFLDPNFKKMKKLNDEERRTTVATIKGLLKHAAIKSENRAAPVSKKRKLIRSETNQKFRDFKDSSSEDEDETDEITEVNHYMGRKFGCVDDVLGFWKSNTEFPNLRQLVRRVLNIPACSTSSEKLFSRNGEILNEKRAQLSQDHMDELLFLHHNLDC